MNCPNCASATKSIKAGDIEIDACEKCGGLWFDRNELFKFDEPHEFDGSVVFKITEKAAAPRKSTPLNCPKCKGQVLVKKFLDHQNKIQIDQCWGCSGIWFDKGELLTLRGQFKTYEERNKAATKMAEDVVTNYKKESSTRTKADIAEYEAKHAGVFRSFLTGFKELFTLDDDPMDV